MKQVMCVRTDADAARAVGVFDVDAPVCPTDGVVVAVKARPINPADLLLLNGRHVYSPELPCPVGIEGAGVVVAAGPASRLAVGTLVAIPHGGTWREQIAVRDDGVLALPADVNVEQAAMLCVNPFTVMGMLEGVPAGATIIINAATSAVSALVLAVARRRVVRDDRSSDRLIAQGATAVLVDGEDLPERARKAAPTPIVRALDAVAGSATGRLYACVSDGGDVVVYGLLSSDQVVLPAAPLVFRDVTVRGFSRLRIFASMSPTRRHEITLELVALLADGTLLTEVEARYPLSDVEAAIAHHERPGRRGKILLVS
jgi:mitochondrial enoyl-[acyl-carrier protein] reductase / trans-2-enoyl-CoA reductase